MSRSYRTLALALVGMLVLVGLAKLVERDPSGSNSAAAAAAPGDTTPERGRCPRWRSACSTGGRPLA